MDTDEKTDDKTTDHETTNLVIPDSVVRSPVSVSIWFHLWVR